MTKKKERNKERKKEKTRKIKRQLYSLDLCLGGTGKR
jgi:hypothetical protein